MSTANHLYRVYLFKKNDFIRGNYENFYLLRDNESNLAGLIYVDENTTSNEIADGINQLAEANNVKSNDLDGIVYAGMERKIADPILGLLNLYIDCFDSAFYQTPIWKGTILNQSFGISFPSHMKDEYADDILYELELMKLSRMLLSKYNPIGTRWEGSMMQIYLFLVTHTPKEMFFYKFV